MLSDPFRQPSTAVPELIAAVSVVEPVGIIELILDWTVKIGGAELGRFLVKSVSGMIIAVCDRVDLEM